MSLESLRPLADHLWQSTVFAAAAGLLTSWRCERTGPACGTVFGWRLPLSF